MSNTAKFIARREDTPTLREAVCHTCGKRLRGHRRDDLESCIEGRIRNLSGQIAEAQQARAHGRDAMIGELSEKPLAHPDAPEPVTPPSDATVFQCPKCAYSTRFGSMYDMHMASCHARPYAP